MKVPKEAWRKHIRKQPRHYGKMDKVHTPKVKYKRNPKHKGDIDYE